MLRSRANNQFWREMRVVPCIHKFVLVRMAQIDIVMGKLGPLSSTGNSHRCIALAF